MQLFILVLRLSAYLSEISPLTFWSSSLIFLTLSLMALIRCKRVKQSPPMSEEKVTEKSVYSSIWLCMFFLKNAGKTLRRFEMRETISEPNLTQPNLT
jgi:hypothetical protein